MLAAGKVRVVCARLGGPSPIAIGMEKAVLLFDTVLYNELMQQVQFLGIAN